MIRLQFYDLATEPAAQLETIDFRITGGVIWNPKEHGLIARYAHGSWKYGDRDYPNVRIEGPCQLHFGITRDPLPVSELIGLFSITGSTLRANGVAFAQYVEQRDMWQGLMRPIWWQAMHFVSVANVPAGMEESGTVLFNPWDPVPSQADSSFTLAIEGQNDVPATLRAIAEAQVKAVSEIVAAEACDTLKSQGSTE